MIFLRNESWGSRGEDDGAMVLEVDTRLTSVDSTSANEYTLPVKNALCDFVIEWGDGTLNEIKNYNESDLKHFYATPGIYTLRIKGLMQGLYNNNAADAVKLTKLKKWGDTQLSEDQASAFRGCINLTYCGDDVPKVALTSLFLMFYDCAKLEGGNFTAWNTASVTTMYATFYGCSAFNQPIGSWDVGRVTTLQDTFRGCSAFNQPIEGWNTANVTNMRSTFYGCSSFNQPIGSWDVGRVTNLQETFRGCSAFNQPIEGWNTANVTNMRSTFYGCVSMEYPLDNWNVGNLLTFSLMLWVGSNPTTRTTDFSKWTFNKNVQPERWLQIQPGTRVFNAPQVDIFLQKFAAAVIGTGRNPMLPKTIGMFPLQRTSASDAAYNALIANGWTFNYEITVI